ncbi:fusion protein comosed of N:signal transduction protein - C:ATPase-like osmosensitive K+ channel histidine kinase [Desulforapulum autotrophicum HRM2]|uniref:histidine kinase n=1 Tax=Desulforapulum autotrophicum (strain ATCC 43914 / DSM 3382 / VKM B-1955 / HRM2) TaxID=177437 RepID=C0QKT4_DESAH|nr:HDOD domain-containing protein [Desulforapulum autotrophicum]ACN16174.1 fusion protein comosed of N:signal transduction protein - C:ATPase-like osmosensitive K+ channel histidine kinase [Desulforapulum autotrophicum HRM2]
MGLQSKSVEVKEQQVFGPKGQRLGRPENLPQLPQVIVKLIEACNNEDTDIRELAGIISMDAALTARLLEIFSSAALNLPKAPKTIESALVYLGMDTIKNIAISVSAMQVFKINRTIPEFDMAAYWRRSYTCAILSKKIALEQKYPHPDESFLAGLLHRIGQLVLLQNFPADYLPIIINCSTSTLDRKKAEQDKFQTTTEEVSSWLFRQWGLNPLMADAVLYLTESPEAVANALDLVKILFMANDLAENSTDTQDLVALFPITSTRLDQMVRETKQEVDTMAESLGLPVTDSLDPSKQEDLTATAENTLAMKVKEISLFHGTLQNLLNAENIDDILTTTENGIRILFNIPRLFYFLFDEGKELLNGWCNPDDKHHRLLDSIAIPMSNTSSLITSSLLKNQMLNSLIPQDVSNGAISDIQITRLLESDGLWAVPMQTFERPIGVIVLGVNNCHRETLHTNRSLLNLFARQTAMCIQSFNQRKEYASLVHDERMQAYTTLTQKIVHEVNNPIVIITNYLTLLSMKLPDRHPVQSELKVIDEEIHRISDLVQRLSNFSKPEIAEFERVNINELYSSVLSIIRKSIFLPRRIEASLIPDPMVPPVRTDKNGLKQVLINLLKNAAEAMDNGGKVTVTTRFVPGSSKILIDEKRKTPGSIEITIQDNGPGISDNIRKNLFEPYNSTKNKENSGLGLSIVHTIIRNLNGTITCDSHSDTGTCFTILLPVNSQGPGPTGMKPDSFDFPN